MRWIMKAALAAIAVMAVAPGANAFETVTNDGYPSTTLSTRLADPDDIIQGMSQRYTGNSATISHFGNTTVGIIGPGYSAGDGPFVSDPAVGHVLSKRQW